MSRREHASDGMESATGTVLLVEDNEGLRDLELAWLDRADRIGATHGAATGEEAIAALERAGGAIDVLVLDRHLPGRDGHEVLATLRDRGFPGRVVVCSAVEPDENLHERNTDAYIQKPVLEDELVGTVQGLLQSDGVSSTRG